MAIRTVTRAGVGLVVGIIILAALVFAGLWFVRERGEQARREEAINIAEEQLQAESDQDIALDTNNDTSSNENSSDQSSTNSTNESQPSTSTDSTSQPSSATELPQTGPEVGFIIAAGVITFAVSSYLESRKLILQKF